MTLDSHDSPRLGSKGSHHLPPYSIFQLLHDTYIRMALFPGLPRKSLEIVLIWTLETLEIHNSLLRPPIGMRFQANLQLSSRAFQGVSHSTCTHRGWVDSQLLMVRNQTANLTLSPSFDHNLCCRCLNGSCKAIFDIYTSRPFQWCKEHLKVRCFDPCNRTLNFWESHFGSVSVVLILLQSGVATVKLANVVQIQFSIHHCKGFETQIFKVSSHFQVVSWKNMVNKKVGNQSGNLTPNH